MDQTDFTHSKLAQTTNDELVEHLDDEQLRAKTEHSSPTKSVISTGAADAAATRSTSITDDLSHSSRPLSVLSTLSLQSSKEGDRQSPKKSRNSFAGSSLSSATLNISSKTNPPSISTSTETINSLDENATHHSMTPHNNEIEQIPYFDAASSYTEDSDQSEEPTVAVAAAAAATASSPVLPVEFIVRAQSETKSAKSTDRSLSKNSSYKTESPPPLSDKSARSTTSLKQRRPPVLLRKRKVSPTKSTGSSNTSPPMHNKQNQEIFSNDLGKFDKPKEALHQCLQQLDSANWEATVIGLSNFVRLLRYHSKLIDPYIHSFTMSLCKHIRNLRSQVSRAACLAAAELFELKGKQLEQEADELSMALLHRTADTNKFLRSDAARALDAMCDNLPTQKTIQILTTKGATHQNAIVRTASAKLLNRLVERIGCDKVFSMNRDLRDKIIITGANLLMEGSLETRNYTKQMFKQLSAHPSFSKCLLDVIPPRTYRNIEKTLNSIQ